MIGDDIRQDVGGAMAIGMRAALVQTGRYRAGDEQSTGTTVHLSAPLALDYFALF